MASALSLFISNEQEARKAEAAARETLTVLAEQIEEQATEAESGAPVLPKGEMMNPAGFRMETMEVNGNDYIGFVSIPALGLELPVLAEWDYELLQLAPCLYAGTIFTNDMVLMGHNYQSHFGRIDELEIGDEVIFTDVAGGLQRYEVAAKDVLAPAAVEEMTAGAYDLTLFTCTYGGADRVTVRCHYAKK